MNDHDLNTYRGFISDRDVKIAELKRLLKRYRDETPLGHQPHMIAHEVDNILDQ